MEGLWELTPFQKNRPKSMKPPRPTQRKFAFKLSYTTIFWYYYFSIKRGSLKVLIIP